MAQLLDPDQWGKGLDVPTGPVDRTDARPPGPRRRTSPDRTPPSAVEPEWDPFEGAEPAEELPRTTAPSRPSPSSSRLPLLLTVVLVVLTVVAGGVWAAASGLLPFAGTPGGAAAPQTSAPPSEEPDPQPEPTPATPAEPSGGSLPASCDDVFSAGMRGQLEGMNLVLNPDWTVTSEPGPPAAEESLIAILDSAATLRCTWAPDGGPTSVGILTGIASVTPEQTATIESTLEAGGYTGISELGGTRYVKEMSSPDGASGFSHIVRDGLWFATRWVNVPVSGYTADMVQTVLG